MGKRVLFGMLESHDLIACMNNRGASHFKVSK
jgi:hypothetical protein